MEGPKSPNQLKPVVDFLNKNLRDQHPWSIAEEYPTVFTDKNIRNIQVIEEDEKVLSHAAIHPMIVRTPYAIFKVGAIGSVVTDPACRKQGLSRKLIEKCLEQAKTENCDFAILWTNLYDFYRKMGFELAGQEISVVWDKAQNISAPGPRRFSDKANIGAETLLSLYSKHTVATVRGLKDTEKYLKIPNTQIFTAWSAENNLKAYAVIGKGADLVDYVHEWGGSTPDLLALFDWIFTSRKKTLTIIIPGHSKGLVGACEKLDLQINHGFLGMIKILNEPGFFKKVTRRIRTLGISDFSITRADNGYSVTSDGESFSVATEMELVKLLFGGPSARTPLKSRLEKVLPLEMWVWGWDSI